MKLPQLVRTAAMVACVVVPNLVWAHPHPKTEVPAADAVTAAPSEVSIAFDEALEPAFSTLSVSDAQGHPVTTTKAELDTATRRQMRLPMPALPPGVYEVKWVAVGVDGHRVNGRYRFTVK